MTAKENGLPSTNQFSELKGLIAESDGGLKRRITTLIEQAGAGLYEREEVMAIAFLGVVSGQNTFLFGPPGTAKSLISRRLASVFKEPAYFEHLMSRFTTPEEVFGPVSIKELKEDRYTRKTKGYLPTAEFAFLDEIWKSSPAILNTLLTLINEHVFKNGEHIETVPLKGLIAASNEVPAENQGLEALYDRFVVRLVVPPVSENANFKALISSKPSESKLKVDPNLLIKFDELNSWKKDIHYVVISDSCMQIIQLIRKELGNQFEELGAYVSDRRWQRAVLFMKASAFFNSRKSTNHSDVILLKHCLWTTPKNRETVNQLVLGAIKLSGIASSEDIAELDLKKEELNKILSVVDFDNQAVNLFDYQTVKLNDGDDYIECDVSFKDHVHHCGTKICDTLYLLYSEVKNNKISTIKSKSDRTYGWLDIEFSENGIITIDHSDFNDTVKIYPVSLIESGPDELKSSVKMLKNDFSGILNTLEAELLNYQNYSDSPFTTIQDTNVAVSGIKDQIDQIKLRIKDCERLESLCRQ